jgi:AraC family transcriptional regulator of adaptative response / DNA-3-methyladenine glycosylase II
VHLPTDVGVRNALAGLGADADGSQWSPWRSYALIHLWHSLATQEQPATQEQLATQDQPVDNTKEMI